MFNTNFSPCFTHFLSVRVTVGLRVLGLPHQAHLDLFFGNYDLFLIAPTTACPVLRSLDSSAPASSAAM